MVGPSLTGPSPVRDLYVTRVGSALNPRRGVQHPDHRGPGEPAQWHDLLNELRQKDGVIHSVLQTREDALLGCPWVLLPYVQTGKRKSTKRAEKIGRAVLGMAAPDPGP